MAAVVALVGGCTSFTRASQSSSPTPVTGQTVTVTAPAPPKTTQTTVAPPPVGMNQEARDGTFAFKVLDVSPTGKKLPGYEEPAQGIYVDAFVSVTNIGKRSRTYFVDYQRLVDIKGREYSPDLHAMAEVGCQERVDINPGNTVFSDLAFDVPEGTQPSDYVLVLYASPDSAGGKRPFAGRLKPARMIRCDSPVLWLSNGSR
jgi:Domain of unknown function (DUF4352)